MPDEKDSRLESAYRALGAEEPPRALDEAILAASRRAVEAHPAPLVAPTGRRAWFVPLAAAAVLVLAVSLTLHLQFEQAGEEKASAPAEPARETTSAPQQLAVPPKAVESPPPELAQARRSPRAEAPARSAAEPEAQKAVQRREPAPFAADSAAQVRERQAELERRAAAPAAVPIAAPAAAPPAAAPVLGAPAVARSVQERASAEAMAKRADAAAETPEKELERIARLRSEGRHEEADKALAEFRKRFPDYKLSEEMRTKVERRP